MENTLKIISEMIKSDKIPGAFIFEGEKSGGTDFISDILAKAIVCENAEHKKKFGESCGVCGACIKSGKGVHPDIIITEPDGEGSLSFHIDKVRDIINGLYLSPNESGRKVYIIKDMQNMTPQGQNALLKSLEEPPPFVVFIITVTSYDLILETVKSRAARFSLEYTDKTIKKASVYGDLIFDILAENPDRLPVYQKLLAKNPEKAEIIQFYSCLENALRDIIVAKIFISRETPDVTFLYFGSFDEIKKLINLYPTKKILDFSKKVHEFKVDLDYNINIRLNIASFLSSLS